MRTEEDIERSKELAIRVHPDGRDLVSGPKDELFFWQADTAWELFHRLDEGEAKFYLDTRASQGFNVVFAVVVAEHGGLTQPNRAGTLPFRGRPGALDIWRLNPAYFEHIDTIVNYAATLGIRIALQPVWGSYVNCVYHVGGATPFDDPKAAEAFGTFLGARYPYTPWLNGGDTMRWWYPDAIADERANRPLDRQVRDYAAVFDGFAAGLAMGEASHHHETLFIAFHPAAAWLPGTPEAYASAWFGDRAWLSVDAVQSGHHTHDLPRRPGDTRNEAQRLQRFDASDSLDLVRKMYAASTASANSGGRARPVLDLEPHYEDTRIGFKPSEREWDATDVRQGAWQALFAGAAGITYGVNSVWQMHRPSVYPPIGGDTEAERDWVNEMHLPGARQVGVLARWAESRPGGRRMPDQSILCGSEEGAGGEDGGLERKGEETEVERRGRNGRDPHVVSAIRGIDGSWAAAYSPSGAAFSVTLDSLQRGTRTAVWFDPRTGEELPREAVHGDTVAVAPPTKGEGCDWVWYVEVTGGPSQSVKDSL